MSLGLQFLRRFARCLFRRAPPSPTETARGYCLVCGSHALFRSYEPRDAPCKRNSFLCERCGASARNRHVAQSVLSRLPTEPPSRSLAEFARHFAGAIWLPSTTGAIAAQLRGGAACVTSEYREGVPSGLLVDGVRCEDIQASSFPDGCLDLVITEDVLEHVASPDAAFVEIRRVLKPGGWHIGTIPINWGRATSVARAVLENGKVRHLLEPEYHGDPMRPEGILAFTDFGCDALTRYCAIVGPSEMLAAHHDRRQEEDFAIYHNWVFVSRKAATG